LGSPQCSRHLDAGVDAGNGEQRIVNPDLLDLVGKRDIRALAGPDTPAATGGYSSGLAVDAEANSFTATYVFTDAAVAKIVASGGGERLLTWQETDAAGNRQGVTIAELGELGGPGMGGGPAARPTSARRRRARPRSSVPPTRPRCRCAPVVAAPPAAGGTFDFRLRGAAAQDARPSTVYVTSDKGRVAGPFTVG
jgi:hypothetical protein